MNGEYDKYDNYEIQTRSHVNHENTKFFLDYEIERK